MPSAGFKFGSPTLNGFEQNEMIALQAPADISFQIENDELSTEIRKICCIGLLIKGFFPYRATNDT